MPGPMGQERPPESFGVQTAAAGASRLHDGLAPSWEHFATQETTAGQRLERVGLQLLGTYTTTLR